MSRIISWQHPEGELETINQLAAVFEGFRDLLKEKGEDIYDSFDMKKGVNMALLLALVAMLKNPRGGFFKQGDVWNALKRIGIENATMAYKVRVMMSHLRSKFR